MRKWQKWSHRGPLENWIRVLGAGIVSPTAVQAYFLQAIEGSVQHAAQIAQ